jgi:hypothetical protein
MSTSVTTLMMLSANEIFSSTSLRLLNGSMILRGPQKARTPEPRYVHSNPVSCRRDMRLDERNLRETPMRTYQDPGLSHGRG